MSWSIDGPPVKDAHIPGWGVTVDKPPLPVEGWYEVMHLLSEESGVGLDQSVIVPRIVSIESALGTDSAKNVLRTVVAEAAVGTDLGTIKGILRGVESAIGSDSARPGVRVSDQGLGSDLAINKPSLIVPDQAVGEDLVLFNKLVAGLGIEDSVGSDEGTAGFTPKTSVLTTYSTVGTFTYTIPVWCSYVDVILLGGGGGGQGAGWAVHGKGGGSSIFAYARLTRGGSIPWTTRTMTVVVGDGGNGGSGGASPATGSYGQLSSINGGTGASQFYSAGGPHGKDRSDVGDGSRPGQPVTGGDGNGNVLTFQGYQYVGGTDQDTPPGAGGYGGTVFAGAGTKGKAGCAWLRAV